MTTDTPNTPATRRTGRPKGTGFASKAILDRLIHHIETGSYLAHAAAAEGLHRDTVYGWLRRGRAERDARNDGATPDPDEARYLRFADAYERARGRSEVSLVSYAHAHAKGGQVKSKTTTTRTYTDSEGRTVTEVEESVQIALPDGRVALEMLGRMFPDDWNRRTPIEVTGKDGGPVTVEHQLGVRLVDAIRASREEGRALPPVQEDGIEDAEILDVEDLGEGPADPSNV